MIKKLNTASIAKTPVTEHANKFAAAASQTSDKNTYAAVSIDGQPQHGKNAMPGTLHPLVSTLVSSITKIEPWAVDNCAEVDAVNKWMYKLATAEERAAGLKT